MVDVRSSVSYSSARMGTSWAVVLSDGVAMWDTNEPRDEESTGGLERYSRHPRIGDGLRHSLRGGLSNVADGRLVESSAVDSARLVGVAALLYVCPDGPWSTDAPDSLPLVANANDSQEASSSNGHHPVCSRRSLRALLLRCGLTAECAHHPRSVVGRMAKTNPARERLRSRCPRLRSGRFFGRRLALLSSDTEHRGYGRRTGHCHQLQPIGN